MKAFNQEKALVGAFSVILKTGCGTDGALLSPQCVRSHDNVRITQCVCGLALGGVEAGAGGCPLPLEEPQVPGPQREAELQGAADHRGRGGHAVLLVSVNLEPVTVLLSCGGLKNL